MNLNHTMLKRECLSFEQIATIHNSSSFSNLHYADYNGMKIVAGAFAGNDATSVALGIGNCDGVLSVRDMATGVMGIYFVQTGTISGWDGSTGRTFVSGHNYFVSGNLVNA